MRLQNCRHKDSYSKSLSYRLLDLIRYNRIFTREISTFKCRRITDYMHSYVRNSVSSKSLSIIKRTAKGHIASTLQHHPSFQCHYQCEHHLAPSFIPVPSSLSTSTPIPLPQALFQHHHWKYHAIINANTTQCHPPFQCHPLFQPPLQYHCLLQHHHWQYHGRHHSPH